MRKGHGDLIANDRFPPCLSVSDWVQSPPKEEEKSAIKQKCQMTEEVNVRGPRVDWKERRQERKKDCEKLQKTG